VFVENRLFATLDPTTRLVQLSPSSQILVTDTVGFIRKLPHHLVASFKSTLEEITEADIILHVVDVSSPYFEDHIKVVEATLEEIGAHEQSALMVFNKIDLLQDRTLIHRLGDKFPSRVFISAARGINISGLKDGIALVLQKEFVERELRIPQMDQRIISQLYDVGEVLDKSYDEDMVVLRLRIPRRDERRVLQLVSDYLPKGKF
jgi:GTP-binding protein HflX